MRYLYLTILFLPLMSGCSALKARTGEYVTEATVDHIAEKIDQRLERRGLSIAQIRSITDLDGDGSTSMAEVRETARLAAGEVAVARVNAWEQSQRAEWETAQKKFVTFDDQTTVKSKLQDFWNYLLATIGALVAAIGSYLTKQVFSAKSDGKRDADIAAGKARMDALERLTGRDLDNDGQIGANGSAAAGHPLPEA